MSEDILNGVPGLVFDAIRAEFAARDDQIDALRGEVLRVRIERDTIGTSLSAARGELSILEADVRGLRGEVERLTAELKAANARADAAEAELSELRGAIRAMIGYRSNNSLNFQLEKFDDYLREISENLEVIRK